MSLSCFPAFVLAVLAVAAIGAGRAAAQEVPPFPLDDNEDYAALGIRAGGFLLFPAVGSDLVFTDNVLRTDGNEKSDFAWSLSPRLKLESDWVRHAFSFEGSSRHLRHFKFTSEDEDEIDAEARARIDIRERTRLELRGAYSLDQEERTSIDVPDDAATPPDEQAVRTRATLSHTFNRLTVALRGGYDMYRYSDARLVGGGVVSNADREFDQISSGTRVSYELSPAIKPFVDAEFSVRDHLQRVDDNGFRRNSDGYEIAAGVEFDLSPILSGEISAGYARRDFDDPRLRPVDGAVVDASLVWRPSALTTVRLTAGTDIAETATTGLSGALVRSAGVSVEHALRTNLILGAAANYRRADYKGGDLVEEYASVSAGATYQLSREVALRAGYAYEIFDTTAGDGYEANTFTVGVLVRR